MLSIFKIFSPEDCDFYYDGDFEGHITGNSEKPFKFVVFRKGEFRFRFVNTKYKSELIRTEVIGIDEEKYVHLDFTEVNADVIKAEEQSRIETQKKEDARLLWWKKHIAQIRDFHDGLAAVQKNGKWGFVNKKGAEVIPCKYTRVGDFSDGRAICENSINVYELIDRNGELVIPFKYYVGDLFDHKFSEGLMRVSIRGKWGYIDVDGKEVIPLRYKAAGNFYNGLAKVQDEYGWSFIDKNGVKVVRDIRNLDLDNEPADFSEGLARVKTCGRWGYADMTGNIFGKYYECAENFTEGLAWIKHPNFDDQFRYHIESLEGRYGSFKPEGPKCYFIDKKGAKVLGPYQGIRSFSEGLAAVMKNYKWGFIDKNGTVVIPFKYDRVGDFHEGLAAVDIEQNPNRPGGKWGYIDRNGNNITSHKYDRAYDFSDGIAKVMLPNLTYGFVDENGTEVIPCKYIYAGEFSEGVVTLSNRHNWCIVDKNGSEVINLP